MWWIGSIWNVPKSLVKVDAFLKEYMNTEQSNENQRLDDMLLKHVVFFLRANWIIIVICGLFGFATERWLSAREPVRYEAVASMRNAQFMTKVVGNNGVFEDVEEPALVVMRLKLDTGYDAATITACGMSADAKAATELLTMVKAETVRTLPSVIDIRVRHHSPEAAQTCANAIFEMVRLRQEKLLEPYKAEMKRTREKLESMAALDKEMLGKMSKMATSSMISLILHDQLRLQARIQSLRIEELNANLTYLELHKTQLIAPVGLPSTPLSTSRISKSLLGLFLGIMAGILIASARRALRK